MNIRNRLATLFTHLMGNPGGRLSDVPFSAVNFEYMGHIYHVTALERRISLQRLPDGSPMAFSTDKGTEHRELAEAVFDGFEWELTTLCKLIDIYEERDRDRP